VSYMLQLRGHMLKSGTGGMLDDFIHCQTQVQGAHKSLKLPKIFCMSIMLSIHWIWEWLVNNKLQRTGKEVPVSQFEEQNAVHKLYICANN